jgi:hypothetical protein
MIIVSVPMLATGAAAMVRAAPAIGTPADTPPLQRVTVVCGQNGCAPVQTKRVQHQKYHP